MIPEPVIWLRDANSAPARDGEAAAPGPGELGARLAEFASEHPGRPLLIADSSLKVRPQDVQALLRLMRREPHATVFTLLSNAEPRLNPFADLEGSERIDQISGDIPAAWVRLLGPGWIHSVDFWPDHFLLFSAAAVEAMAAGDGGDRSEISRLRAAGGRLLVADSLFARWEHLPLNHATRLEAHEQRRMAPWGALTARLENWLEAGITRVDDAFTEGRLRTLHITHSWGGGVAQWVESFISADPSSSHFQLRSEGPQTGQGCGQKLSLYLGNELAAPMASWWLDPSIRASCGENQQYREILECVIQRYGIGRIIVSSLVGHSLEGLQTGLPTIEVLHDFYPAWPLLDVHPEPYVGLDSSSRLEQALERHALLPEFRQQDAGEWRKLGEDWRAALAANPVHLVAPSQSVVTMLRRLDPQWETLGIEIIHHGLAPLPSGAPVVPLERSDGKLRLVVPGRMQEGKGQSLLLAALPELTRHAQVYLLGAGKDGEVFFGRPGVNVVTQYRREDLPALMRTIGPHLAALLSTVPETFSYMLSELRELEIPVLATRVGSLGERIEDGVDGWLIEPSADALTAKIRAIAAQPETLAELRKSSVENRKTKNNPLSAAEMVERYNALCPPKPAAEFLGNTPTLQDIQLAAASERAARLQQDHRFAKQQVDSLQAEVEKRTEWATEREKALQHEQEARKRWVANLESDIASLTASLSHEKQRVARLEADYDSVINSSSWRVTRPLRAARRVAENLARARVWNPARWPLLISQAIRTVSTLGWRGALLRSQQSQLKNEVSAPQFADRIDAIGSPEAPDSLPRAEKPLVSIVIPVYNQWEFTAACLRSVARARNKASYEVIVVDDHSGDESEARLSAIDGLNYLRNKKNVGFVGSCNRGAEAARGAYILLLNNDTQMFDGWLDALLKTFDDYPDTGLAGARLVYPDGRLQEAGGIIFSDGSGWNYGKGDRADKPEYNFSREVDYCSGACIMLPADLYRELGGLDNRYAPAYYEDTDLAFRVRAAGRKVRLQGAATVVHFEGATAGTDVTRGTKRYQEVNRKKFLQRWQSELATFPAPLADAQSSKLLRQARDHHLAGRVLIIDAYTPEPDQDSGSLRLRHLFDCFRELGYGVTFFADNRGYAGRYSSELQQAGVEILFNPWIESLAEFFSQRGDEFDYILISRHYVAANYVSLIRKFCPKARFIFDTVDLHYLREQRMAELEDSLPLRRVAAQTRRSELAVIREAAATLVVSDVEKEVLARDAPEARVHVLSNIHALSADSPGFGERKDIFFVGGYQHPPNIDAAQWFVSSIWPLIRERLPEIRFHLIGSKAPEKIRALDGNGVVFHGFVEDLEPWLEGCRLSVAPLRYGAGVKGKVNLSMAHGQPVVATPMAVEGLYATSGKDILVAETAEDFAAAVVSLYQDEALWLRLSQGGRENVRQHFSVERATQNLKTILESLAVKPPL